MSLLRVRLSRILTSTKMRQPRLYVSALASAAGEVVLSERNHHYLARVLRARIGQTLELFDGEGQVAPATIHAIDKRQTVVIQETPHAMPDHRLPVTLGLCIIKSDRFDWALQKATELGVTAITPVISAYTDSPPKGERLEKKVQHWQEILVNACEQSENNWLPKLHPVTSLDALDFGDQQAVFAHPETTTDAIDPTSPAWLLIGPEGGFDAHEVEMLLKKQVKPMALGPRILRAETAAIVGLTLLGQRYGQY